VERALGLTAASWGAEENLDQARAVLVDLSTHAGLSRLEALRQTTHGLSLPAVGLVDPKEPVRPALDSVAVDALVSLDRLEELPWRFAHAQLRRTSTREAVARERHLAVLLELTGRYTESLDPTALLYEVTRRLVEAMEISRASMVMVDEAQQYGFVVAASDDARLKDLRIELSRYPEVQETLRTGKPVIVEDVTSHPLLDRVQSEVAAKGIRTIACLPLAVQSKVLGVLLVRAKDKTFSLREIDFLATVAHATAVAMRNATLFETFRGQTEKEKKARIAAEQRAESLKRYESYFANLSDGIAILDEAGKVITLNPAGTELLDVNLEQARGQHIQVVAHALDPRAVQEVLNAAVRGQVRRDVDLAIRAPRGARLTLSVSSAPLVEGEAAVILSFRDVTVQRRMEEELRQTKEFLERLIDSSVDAIIAADLRGNVILFNKGAESITGYTAEEALHGLNVRQLYGPGGAQQVMAWLRGPDFGGKGRLTGARQEIIRKEGTRVPVSMTASILYERDKEVATVGIFADLRDREALERKLTDAQIRAETSERHAAIVALAGAAAHELNQPLTSVMGYAEVLKRKLKEEDPAFRPAEVIYREAERMAEIVRKIGKITRFETMPYVGDSEILDLNKASSDGE
jgi:PAS domain S-box-containing protein